MFGLLRTILAIVVMVGHLLDKWQIGVCAVFGFYMISGYLMTFIMHENYGYSATGRIRFALNRFLRLYPLYWIAALISLALIMWLGVEYTRSYNPGIYPTDSPAAVLANVSMIYPQWFANEYKPILVPTTWAITVELFFYACICLGLAKTRARVNLWLLLSIGYVLYCFVQDLGWRYRYFPIFAASFPFAMGAAIYFLKKEGMGFIDDWLLSPTVLLAGILCNMLLIVIIPMYFEMGFYINTLLCVLLCYQLAVGGSWRAVSPRIDKIIGEYSYPIYLLHWQAGIVASYLLFSQPFHYFSLASAKSLVLALLIVTVVAYLLIKYVDRPIQRLRIAVKQPPANTTAV